MSVVQKTFSDMAALARRHSEILVALSGGKDSLAVMDICAKSFPKVQAFFKYLVPGLAVLEKQFQFEQIDALEGKQDYSLTVAVLDVDEKRERELNVLLNNQEVAGEWDMEKLKALLQEEVDLLNTGFDQAEFMKMFGEAPSQPSSKHQEDLSKQLAAVKEAYEKLRKMGRTKDDMDFYNVVVFGCFNERKEFLDEFGFEDNRYIDGRTLLQILRGYKALLATDNP